MTDDIEFLPGIDEYLEKSNNSYPISIKDHEELLYLIRAKSGLDLDSINIIASAILEEVRRNLIKGKQVALTNYYFMRPFNNRIIIRTTAKINNVVDSKYDFRKFMITDESISESSNEELITYIAIYRSLTFVFLKKRVSKCIQELYSRSDTIDFEKLIQEREEFLKEAGRGFIATVSDLGIIDKLGEIIGKEPIIYSKDNKQIFVGKLNKDQITSITSLEGVLVLEKDKVVVKNAIGTKVSK